MKLKTELFREKMLQEDLKNRMHAGMELKQLRDENYRWMVEGTGGET